MNWRLQRLLTIKIRLLKLPKACLIATHWLLASQTLTRLQAVTTAGLAKPARLATQSRCPRRRLTLRSLSYHPSCGQFAPQRLPAQPPRSAKNHRFPDARAQTGSVLCHWASTCTGNRYNSAIFTIASLRFRKFHHGFISIKSVSHVSCISHLAS